MKRQGAPAATFEEWKAREDMPVLDLGVVKLPEDAA